MRAVSLHPDVILVTSQIWQTNCTIVRAGEDAGSARHGEGGAGAGAECFVIDSPVLPEELEALPTLLAQMGVAHGPSGLLATHGDWDHLLGRLAFPGASLGCAQSTERRLRAAPGEPQRELRAFDEEYYLARGPLALGSLQALPVPGRLALGAHELQLHPAEGHTCDGMAIALPWAKVLVVGDYLSAVEIPFLGEGGGTLASYQATLERLRALLGEAEHVVPGHGPALDATRALAVLEEDLAYLQALAEHGAKAPLPEGRRSEAQRRMHSENCVALGFAGSS